MEEESKQEYLTGESTTPGRSGVVGKYLIGVLVAAIGVCIYLIADGACATSAQPPYREVGGHVYECSYPNCLAYDETTGETEVMRKGDTLQPAVDGIRPVGYGWRFICEHHGTVRFPWPPWWQW